MSRLSRSALIPAAVFLTSVLLRAQAPTLYGTPQTAYYDDWSDPYTTSLTVGLPNGGAEVSADTIYIFQTGSRAGAYSYNPGMTVPAGVIQECAVQEGQYELAQTFYEIFPAGSIPPTSQTFSQDGGWGTAGIIVMAYQGINAASPFDGGCQSGTAGVNATSVTVPSIITSVANDTAVWNYYVSGDAGIPQPTLSEGTMEAQITRQQFGGDAYMNYTDMAMSSPASTGANTLTWYPVDGEFSNGSMAIGLALAPAPPPAGAAIGSLAPFSTLTSGPGDTMNLANLDVHLSVPIMHKEGRGMPFGFLYTYDSNIYTAGASGTAWTPSPGFGWAPQLEVSTGYLTYRTGSTQCQVPGPDEPGLPPSGTYESFAVYSNFVFYDQNGVAHPFNVTASDGNDDCDVSATSGSGAATDQSGYVLSASGSESSYGVPQQVDLQTPAGMNISPPLGSPLAAGQEEDSNGNTITIQGSGSFTDTLGMTALTMTGTNPVTLSYSDASGNPVQATVNYSSYTVRTNFGIPGIAEYSATNVPLLSSVSLPNGTSWTFTYEATPGYPGDVTGRIASVQLPSGGTIGYSYTGSNNGIFGDGSAAGLTRTSPDGTFTYSRSLGSGAFSSTTATDPAGNQTVYDFQGNLQTERQVYQGLVSGGTLLQTVTTCYNGATPDCTGTAITAPPITERRVTTTSDTGLVSARDEFYSSAELPTETDIYGYGSGAPGALVRKTTVSYASFDNNILDRPQEVAVFDGSSNQIADTQFQYDTGSVESSGFGNPVSGSRGNATVVKKWISGSTWSTTNLAWYDTGELYTSTDPNGNTTSFNFWGNSCNGAFPIGTSLPAGLSASATWNCYLGQIASSTDPNGNTTTYSYDAMGRPTQVDAPGTSAGLIESVIQYNDAANTVESWQSTTTDALPASDTGWLHAKKVLDWAGRVTDQELVNDPDGLNQVVTTYDGLGRAASQTNPFYSTSDPTCGVTQESFDALNRPVSQTNQDSSTASSYYGGQVGANGGLASPQCSGEVGYPVEVVSAAGRHSQVWLDADGHVLEADEPDPASGSLTGGEAATCYGYTAAGQLAWVHQGAQERALAYDGLGRVIYSRFPEAAANISGPSVDGSASWSEAIVYDADGNPVQRTDASGAIATLSYDGLNRMTGETFSDGTPAVSFKYDSTTGCTVPSGASPTNLAGRRACALGGAGTYTLYSYDPAGNVTDTWDQAPDVLAHQGYGYYFNGQLASYTNPEGDSFTYRKGTASPIRWIRRGG